MGNCLKPLKKASNEPPAAAKNRAGHMGPDGVENSIFQGNGNIDYSQEQAAAGSRIKTPGLNGQDPNNVQLTVDMGPLDHLHNRAANGANGVNGNGNGNDRPPPGSALPGQDPNTAPVGMPPQLQGAAPGVGPAGPQGEQAKPKQAVMRRSFPPVGVLLQLDRPADQVPVLEGQADMTEPIAAELASVMEFGKDRIRVMHARAGSKEVKLNIVADRTDVDSRSPMQLAAMLVQQASNPQSALRQQPISKHFATAQIAEDPFPGTKQDSWAGGVAMLRPPSPKAGKKKKEPQPAAGSVSIPMPDIPGIGAGGGGPKRKSAEEKVAAAAADAILQAPRRSAKNKEEKAVADAGVEAAEALLGKPIDSAIINRTTSNESKMPDPPANVDPQLVAAAKNTSELPGGSLAKEKGVYAGEILNGMRHGRGKQNYPNGDVYVGCFKEDKRSGIGRLNLSGEAGTYLGEWDNDERNGKGSWTYPNKDVYVGTWKDGLRSGEGRLVMSSGAWYKGDFKKDLYHGKGQMQFENKDTYEGGFVEGHMHGAGTYTTAATGATENGVWHMGQRSDGGRGPTQEAGGHPKKGLGTVIIDDLQDDSQKPHEVPQPPMPTQEFKPPPNPAPSAQHPGARGPASSNPPPTAQRTSSIKDAKPPVRSVRSGASMKTDDTLKLVSDRLNQWVSEEGGRMKRRFGDSDDECSIIAKIVQSPSPEDAERLGRAPL